MVDSGLGDRLHDRSARRVRLAMIGIVAALIGVAVVAQARAGDNSSGIGGSIFDDNFKPQPNAPIKPAPKPAEAPPPPPRLPPARLPAEIPKPTPAPDTPSNPTPTPRTVSVPTRFPVPKTTELAPVEKLVTEVYADEYKVHTPAGRTALARALLNEIQQSPQDRPTLYVLLRNARDLATAGGDAPSAVQAVRGLRDSFLIGEKEAADMERASLLSAAVVLAGTPPTIPPAPEVRSTIMMLMALAERDLAAGNYAAAEQIAIQAESVARRTNDASLAERVHERSVAMQTIAAEFEKAKDALATLKTNPSDPAASATVGKLYALVLDRADVGMKLLAAGNDPAIKALAAEEVAAPTDPARQSALAEGWAALTKTTPAGVMHDGMRRRAIYWCDAAASQASGLAKVSAEKRASELGNVNLKHGLIGQYYRGANFDKLLFTRVDPKIEFNWHGQQPDEDLTPEYFSIRWTGFIKAGAAGAYQLLIVHDDGARVWLDGQLVVDKWGDVGRDSVSVQLTGAPQSLKIEYDQREGDSYFGLAWTPPRKTKAQVIPAEFLFHAEHPASPLLEPIQPQPDADGHITLAAGGATYHNPGVLRLIHSGDSVGYWHSMATSFSWEFAAPAGDYEVTAKYACEGSNRGSEYLFVAGNNRLTSRVEDTGGWNSYGVHDMGRIHLTGGMQTIHLNALSKPSVSVMNFSGITLVPVRESEKQ